MMTSERIILQRFKELREGRENELQSQEAEISEKKEKEEESLEEIKSAAERAKAKRRRKQLEKKPMTAERRKRSKAMKKARKKNKAAFAKGAKKAAKMRKLYMSIDDILSDAINEADFDTAFFSLGLDAMTNMVELFALQDWENDEEKLETYSEFIAPFFESYNTFKSEVENLEEDAELDLTSFRTLCEFLDGLFEDEEPEEESKKEESKKEEPEDGDLEDE